MTATLHLRTASNRMIRLRLLEVMRQYSIASNGTAIGEGDVVQLQTVVRLQRLRNGLRRR